MALLVILSLSACGGSREAQSSHYFGFMELEPLGDADDAVRGRSIETFGLRVGPGVGLGYFDETLVSVREDCRLVIFVPTEAALDRVLTVLKDWDKGELCTTVSDFSVR